VLIVVEPEHRDALETSPDFATLAEPCRRAERPRRRVSVAIAALDCPPQPLATGFAPPPLACKSP
jgi:hypothetical protein